MIDMITPEKLKQAGIDHDADHLADAMRYAFHTAFMHLPKTKVLCL